MTARICIVMLVTAVCMVGCKKKPAPDLSSPKAAAKAFDTAIEAGDADGAKACMNLQTEAQRKLADAYIGVAIAYGKLHSAAVAKFGDAAKRISGDDNPLIFLDNLDSVEEKINGDSATLTPKAGREVMAFKKIDGQWKIEIGTTTDGKSAADLAIVPKLEMMTRVYKDVTDEIGAGTYTRADHAREAVDKKMREGLFGVMGRTGS